MTFTVAIVGRPNVGKSTLFNRLCGKKLALVHDTPGLTRDWRMADALLMGTLAFRVIDTAGLEESFDSSIQGRMRRQTESAIAQADFVLLVVDARTGITEMDKHFAAWLRRQKIPSALLANKCESRTGMDGLYEAYELGLGEPIGISAEHNIGMDDVYAILKPHVEKSEMKQQAEDDDDDVERLFQKYQEGGEVGFGDEPEQVEDVERPIRIAIVGRPNVGKSTLLNALVGSERSMTGPEAGITRDAVHVDWVYKDRKMQLVDTAGIRRKAKIIDQIEKMSADDSFRAIRLAQVVIMMIDSVELFSHQDLAIASHVIEEGRALVIAVNKWDVAEDREETLDEVKYQLGKSLAQVRDVPFVTISALNNVRLDKLMDAVLDVYGLWNKRISTGKLNRWLASKESQNPAPLVGGRQNRLRYITQIKSRPPTFALWVGRADDYPDTHKRYLINGLREDFELPAVPVRLLVRASKNPYAD